MGICGAYAIRPYTGTQKWDGLWWLTLRANDPLTMMGNYSSPVGPFGGRIRYAPTPRHENQTRNRFSKNMFL